MVRHRHQPKLTSQQVREMRKRVLPDGDLNGKSIKSVGEAYNVGPGEAAKALQGLAAYSGYTQEGRIKDLGDYLHRPPGNNLVFPYPADVDIYEELGPETEWLQDSHPLDSVTLNPPVVITKKPASAGGTIFTRREGTKMVNSAVEADREAAKNLRDSMRGVRADRQPIPVEEAIAIREDRRNGMSFPELSKKYGRVDSVIRKIVYGKKDTRWGVFEPIFITDERRSEGNKDVPTTIPAHTPTKGAKRTYTERDKIADWTIRSVLAAHRPPNNMNVTEIWKNHPYLRRQDIVDIINGVIKEKRVAVPEVPEVMQPVVEPSPLADKADRIKVLEGSSNVVEPAIPQRTPFNIAPPPLPVIRPATPITDAPTKPQEAPAQPEAPITPATPTASAQDPLGLIRAMLQAVGPKALGWQRTPSGKTIESILSDLQAAHEMQQTALAELAEWVALSQQEA